MDRTTFLGLDMLSLTAVGSYPQCTMQSRHFRFPLAIPYFVQSVVSMSSLKVFA